MYALLHALAAGRFALDVASSAPKGPDGIAVGTYKLFAGMIEFRLSRHLSRTLTVTNLRMERILRGAGWPPARIGEPHTMGTPAPWPDMSMFPPTAWMPFDGTAVFHGRCSGHRWPAGSRDV
ncbi:hypothetical protein NKH71_32445 [Mesorhizobium sp. M0983]|uniref:acyl-homoserine-lactone synthase n=1 Tax=Mesorhizobium sp. M0983 TaxID=2957040 RepID=UPI00333A85C3